MLKEKPTLWWLCCVSDSLEGGTGDSVRLFGGSSLCYPFPKGLGQTALQELPACPELLVILGVFRSLVAALIEDGNHSGRPLRGLLLIQRGHFGAWCKNPDR